MIGQIFTILNSADAIAKEGVIYGYAALVEVYKPMILSLMGLSITALGYAVVNGWVQLSLAVLSKRVLLAGAVAGLALHWDFFARFIFDFLMNAPSEIAVHLVKAIPNTHYPDANSIYEALQSYFDDGIKFGNACIDLAGITLLMPAVWGVFTLLATYAFTGIALFDLVMAKLGLSICLMLSPLMMPLLLFETTKGIFDGWTKVTLGFALMPVFVMAGLALSLMLQNSLIGDLNQAIVNHKLNAQSLSPYFLCSLVNIGLMLKATEMAASIAGGFSASISQSAARFTVGAGGRAGRAAAKATASGIKAGVNKLASLIRGKS